MKTPILGIDPGSDKSGWVLWSGTHVIDCGVEPNTTIAHEIIPTHAHAPCVIELLVPYVMTTQGGHPYVPTQVASTLRWIGRFEHIYEENSDDLLLPVLVTRSKVLSTLKANKRNAGTGDSQVLRALKYRYGDKGTKANPGPMYGLASHAWQALAAVVTAEDLNLIE